MTMLAEWQTRVPLQRRVELTNRTDNPDAIVEDTAITDAAIADVAGDFLTYAGFTFDTTNPEPEEISQAILGIMLYLEAWKGDSERAWAKIEAWQKKINVGLRKIKGNNRIPPKSSSELTPAEENPTGIEVRPDFDLNETFDDVVPGKRTGSRRHQ